MSDITVKFEEGKFNFRVAVIVEYNEKILVQEERGDENLIVILSQADSTFYLG